MKFKTKSLFLALFIGTIGLISARDYQFKPTLQELITKAKKEAHTNVHLSTTKDEELYYTIHESTFRAILECMNHYQAPDFITMKKSFDLIKPLLEEQIASHCSNDQMNKTAHLSLHDLSEKLKSIQENSISPMPEGGLHVAKMRHYTLTPEMQEEINKVFSALNKS